MQVKRGGKKRRKLAMMISDAVVSNLTTLYLGVIAAIKAYGVISGRSFAGWFVVAVSTTVVGAIVVGTLTWDVSRKATYALSLPRPHHVQDKCRGGICWHRVSVGSTVSQLRFQLPPHPLSAAASL